MPLRNLVVAAFLAAGAAGGCVHTDVHRLARFCPGVSPLVVTAPTTGVYKVRYAAAEGGAMRDLGESERIVRKGDRLGFRVADDGSVLAVAGAEEFTVAAGPGGLRKCVWYVRTEKPSQFSREVYKAATTTAQVGAAAGAGAGLIALGVGGLVLEKAIDDALCEQGGDCEDLPGPASGGGGHHHHHHHGGGGGGSKPPKPAERIGARNP